VKLRRNPAFGKALAPAEDPKGRLDLLAVRLIEGMLKVRFNAPGDSVLSVDLLNLGQIACDHFHIKGFAELCPELERIAREQGVSTEQTLPELARSLGLLRGPRARVNAKQREATRSNAKSRRRLACTQ
jgi:hypothetical protein